MKITALRARAEVKGVRIAKRGDSFTLIDNNNEEILGVVEGLLALEDKINWIEAGRVVQERKSTVTLTIGWRHHSKMGDPQVVEYHEGTPIEIEELDLVIEIANGAIEIRGTGITIPVIRATSANSIKIRPEFMQDWSGPRTPS